MSNVDFDCICPNSLCQSVPSHPFSIRWHFLPAGCPLLSITLSSPCKKDALCPRSHIHTHTHTHTHTSERKRRGRRGTDTCRAFVTSSAGICDRTALWERRPSVVGKAGLEGGKRARCIMLLFSVGLSCVKCCVVKVFLLFSSYRRYSAKIIQQQEDGKLNSAIDKLQMQLRSCCDSVKSNCSFS